MDMNNHSSLAKGYRVIENSSAATTNGVNYEKYMYLLILLRLLEDNDISEFHIAQNIANVGAFDDLVVRVICKSGRGENIRKKLIFIQLKHSENKSITLNALTGIEGKGKLQLGKYYDSYKLIIGKIGKFADAILKECEASDMIFVIYTNAYCSFGDDGYPSNAYCRKLLETNTKKSKVFNLNSLKLNKKFHDLMKKNNNPIYREEEGNEFLQQLILFSDQSNIYTLPKIVEEKLITYVKEDSTIAVEMSFKFIARNKKYWLSGTSGALFDVACKFQGQLVRLNEMSQFWTKFIITSILVKHISKPAEADIVSIGKDMQPSADYYIERIIYSEDAITDPERSDLEHRRSLLDSTSATGQLAYTEAVWREEISLEPLILLCAKPGMGKSTFFTRQAELIKRKFPEKLVIKGNLVDYSEDLHLMDISKKEAAAIMFLETIAQITPDTVEYDIFHYSLRADNMLVVFLDGVDEISPYYYDKFLIIIQTICCKFKVQLWVSTRPIDYTTNLKISKDLGITAMTLREFSNRDSKSFLKKYCNSRRSKIVNEMNSDLFGIPIFCRIFGDIINNSGEHAHGKHFKGKVDLYDKLVDVVFQVYHKEKMKSNVNIPAYRQNMERLISLSIQEHEKAALLEILDIELLEFNWDIENECKELFSKIAEAGERTGLIVKVVNGKPTFIHRSIAEYFCGLWFSENVNKYREYIKIHTRLPLEVDFFMSCKLKNLSNFFVIIMKENNKEILEEFLSKNISKFNDVDPLGRNALHYANISGNQHAFEYLLRNGLNITEEIITKYFQTPTVRKILSSSWLEATLAKYSQHARLLGFLKLGMENQISCDDDLNIKMITDIRVQNYRSHNLPLHDAIQESDLERVKYLARKKSMFFQHPVNRQDANGRTALHVAAALEENDRNALHSLLSVGGVNYIEDNYGYYPHEYASSWWVQQKLLGFGFAGVLDCLNKSDRYIFGKNIKNVLTSYVVSTEFIGGMDFHNDCKGEPIYVWFPKELKQYLIIRKLTLFLLQKLNPETENKSYFRRFISSVKLNTFVLLVTAFAGYLVNIR